MPLSRKVAFINLSNQHLEVKEIPLELRKKFLGGRGINMYFLLNLVKKGIDAFDAENPLILGTGLLTGTVCGRMNVSGKSPESGYLGDSNVGGYFGAELSGTGYSHVIITGKSPEPVYLYIENERIYFRDASHLWGETTWDCQRAIRNELHDEKVKILCIGPAGENLVRFASIMTGLKNAAGRTGLGALMGSKRLKAVAVRGSKGYRITKPREFLSILREANKKATETGWGEALGFFGTPLLFKNANALGFTSYKYHQFTTVGDAGKELYAENLVENYSRGMVSCYGCPIHCRHRYKVNEGKFGTVQGEGPEYASITSLGPTLGNLSMESVLHLTELCNKYGVDTISGGNYLAYAFALFEKGLLSEREVGYKLSWGDHAAIERLLVDTICRRKFGNILAEGSFAWRKLKPEAKNYLLAIKNVSLEQTDERPVKAFALGLGVATRGTCHMRSRASVDVVRYPREVLSKFYGADVGHDFRDYQGKAKMVWWHELFNAVVDSVGLCRFASIFSSINAIGYPDISRLLEYAIGFRLNEGELLAIGERIYTAERLFLSREGISRKDDYLPDLYYDTPIPEGPAQGEFIDREKYDQLLDEYYAVHGWDRNGIPPEACLKELGLRAVADETVYEDKSK